MVEQYMFRGKTVSSGEWVTGYYVFQPKRSGGFGQAVTSNDFDKHIICSPRKSTDIWEVNPATVEPVAAKVVTSKHKMNEIAGCLNDYWITHFMCPNCNNTLQQKRERIDDNGNVKYADSIYMFKYCHECGQRLSWEED